MFELFNLPLEIQEEILNKCESYDIQNLACCSSYCKELLKTRLWSRLVIPWWSLLNVDWRHSVEKNKLRNLKLAKEVVFNALGVRLRKSPQKVVVNFQKLITHCDPAALQSLRMHDQVNGLIAYACQQLTGLRVVDFSRVTDLSDDVFTQLNKLTSLMVVNLNDTNTEDGHLILIATNLKGLHKLKLNYCTDLTQRSLRLCVKNLIHLKELTLRGTHCVNDTIFYLINNNLLLLERLDISATKITNKGMEDIVKLKYLKHLDVTACAFLEDISMSYVARLSNLQSLDISDSNITDQGVWYLSSLVRLKHLKMYSCENITDKAMSHLKKFSSLEKLDISYNWITDVGLGHLFSLEKLKLLDCRNNAITEVALQPFFERMEVTWNYDA